MLCGSHYNYSFHFMFGAFTQLKRWPEGCHCLTAAFFCLPCRIACCTTLQAAVYAFRLEKCWPPDWQLLLDGRQVRHCWVMLMREQCSQEVHVPAMQITGLTGARGPQIGKLQQQLLCWQLAHPNASKTVAEQLIKQWASAA